MKLVAVFLLALVAAIAASPTSIQDNNIGDIVNVGVNANLSISNKVDQNIIGIIVGMLSQQGIIVALPGEVPAAEAEAVEAKPESLEDTFAKMFLQN